MIVDMILGEKVIEAMLVSMLIPKAVLCLFVFCFFGKKFVSFAVKRNNTPIEWLIIGISVNFIGLFVDAAFWLFALSVDLLKIDVFHEYRSMFFYFNTYIRVLFTSIAAWCYCNSAIMHSKQNGSEPNVTYSIFVLILSISILTSLAYTFTLISQWT